ncbi:MAG: hypothetical protein P8008_05625, partial [Gammaproteobacteria bacterium]
FEEVLERVYTDIRKEAFQVRRDEQENELQRNLIDRMLHAPDSLSDEVLPFALFYLDLPGVDYVLSPSAAALREQVDLLMISANDPRQLKVVRDIMDYSASTWALQDQRWVQLNAGTAPAPLKPLLLEAGLRDPALVWQYSALNDFGNSTAMLDFRFTGREREIARALLEDPRVRRRLESLAAQKENYFYAVTRGRTVDVLIQKVREAYPDLKLQFEDLSIVGTAVNPGADLGAAWGTDRPMAPVPGRPGLWTLDTELAPGFFKFRAGGTWDENWGGVDFASGELSWFGDNIEIRDAGRYRVTLDLERERFEVQRLEG